MEDITARLTDYILSARWADLPDAVRHEALRSTFNILGCAIGGARHDIVDRADQALTPFAGAPRATVIGRGRKSDALHACLINCLGSSVYSFDDTHAEAVVHPAGPVATAALALTELRPAKGADVLMAIALGIEAMCRLSKSISVPPAQGTIAWSQTGITGGLGAVVAAGRLLQLDATRFCNAIGIALSQAAGFRAMHGTMCTPFMPAQGGQTGLRAALLAERGFTASQTPLEGRYGYLSVFAEKADTDALVGGLGERFELLRNTYKPYPCGIVIHPIIDACLQLRAQHELDARQIERVTINASPGALALCDRPQPKDELQAHVSLQHWTAISFIRGTTRISDMSDETVVDPTIAAFRNKVSATAVASIAADAAEVTVVLRDGRRLACRIDHCIGSAAQPMTDAQLTQKFGDLAEPVIGATRTKELIDRAWAMEAMADVGDLARAAA